MKVNITKIIYAYIISSMVASCDLGMPRLLVNYDHLPQNEISDFIIRKFPNNDEDGLKKIINDKLNNDYSEDNIKRTVSKMGMVCITESNNCEYDGYVVTTLLKDGTKSSAKQIYNASINTKQGIDSFYLKKDIINY
ncbi:MAG: hypothetical protein Q4A74_09730 [Cardiobacteriaceae bacterium]|nr:hypothetical protein [Cardiobacteriaceae bacterium]